MDLLTLNSLPSDLCNPIALRKLAPEQILFRQGDAASTLFVVETGRLKVGRYTCERRLVTFQIARSGECLGASALFANHYPYTAIAEAPSQVVAYSKQAFLSALRQNLDLAEEVMAVLSKQNLALMTQLELRDIRAAHQRVLQYLYYLTKFDLPLQDSEFEESKIIKFDRPLKDVALGLGLTPATLSRALARLEREGMIIREQNLIRLKNSSPLLAQNSSALVV
jgi:CRP/FNR family transcriptional regulator, dissimilatory nitrate respiration regulator